MTALLSQARSFEDTANAVLRRVLNLDVSETQAQEGPAAAPAVDGEERRGTAWLWATLPELLRACVVRDGDWLICHRPHTGRTHRAVITAAGRLRLEDGRESDSVGGALKMATGENLNAWSTWVHEPSGLTLDELRARHARETGNER